MYRTTLHTYATWLTCDIETLDLTVEIDDGSTFALLSFTQRGRAPKLVNEVGPMTCDSRGLIIIKVTLFFLPDTLRYQ